MLAPREENPSLTSAMHRTLLFLCTLAIGCAALLGGLYFRTSAGKKEVEARLVDESNRAAKLSADLTVTQAQSKAQTARIGTLESDLNDTKAKLTAATSRATELDRNLTQAKNALAVHELNARALAAELEALRRDLAGSRASAASPQAVAAYKATIAELERQLAAAGSGAAAVNAAGASTAVFSSRAGRASVLTVGPGNAFVVLNFGTSRGAQPGQKLDIVQGTTPVATVTLSDVRPNFSIGQVSPETLRADLQKGDSALLVP